MPKCSVRKSGCVGCGVRKSGNRECLTLHRLPRSEFKKKWLEAIGTENIRPNLKDIFICSHFHEDSFNKILDVIRLRDDALPSLFPPSCSGQDTSAILTENRPDQTLILDMKSAVKLYEDVVENLGLLKYVPMYKVSQDHLELFFSSIRARGGFNNYPNAVHAAYKRLLVSAEIRGGGIGNCIAVEQINILICSSASPVQNINDLTEKNRFVKIEEDHSELYDEYFQLLTSDLNKYCAIVTEYISGFVTKKTGKKFEV